MAEATVFCTQSDVSATENGHCPNICPSELCIMVKIPKISSDINDTRISDAIIFLNKADI